MDLLGEKIKLEGWKGYRGDLDVVHNRNGEYARYTKIREKFEVHINQSIHPSPWV